MAKTEVMDLEKYVKAMEQKGLTQKKKNDIATLCPFCYMEHKKQGDDKYRKLKLWVKDNYDYGHCWVCGTIYVTDRNQLQLGVHLRESPVDMSNWKLCKLGNDGYWTLDRFQEFDEYDEEGVNYLAHRVYLYREMYKYLGIRFKDHNPVVPFYYKGELCYYQMRIIDPNSKIKYYSPHIDHKMPYILEKKNSRKWVISEGTFDCMADRLLFPDRSAFGVLGSDITDYEIAILRSYVPEDIMIYMDKTSISMRIKEKLEKYINYANIHIHRSEGQDPEEFFKEKLIENL